MPKAVRGRGQEALKSQANGYSRAIGMAEEQIDNGLDMDDDKLAGGAKERAEVR